MNYYLKVLRNYATFSGRAMRSEYWYFVLFNLIFGLIAMGLDNVLGTTFTINIPGAPVEPNLGLITPYHLPYGYLYLAYGLFMFIPGLAVSVRRLHDVNKSGWFMFISLIPIIGAIWILVLFFTEGTPGPNEYGEDPNAVAPEFV